MADVVDRLRDWASIDSGERRTLLVDAAEALARVTRERDAALAACESLVNTIDDESEVFAPEHEEYVLARAALVLAGRITPTPEG